MSKKNIEKYIPEAMRVLKEEFSDGLKYFDMLLKDPNLTPEALQKVKTTTIGSLSSKANDFDYVAGNELKKLLFAGTPLGHSSLGTKESIEKLKLINIEEFIKIKEQFPDTGGESEDFSSRR